MYTIALLMACLSPQASDAPMAQTPPPEPATKAAPEPQDRQIQGICDGSAGVQLDDGSLLLAYDETNHLYRWSGQGAVIEGPDLRDALGLSSDDEMDLEGAARDGDRVWWIGSHGLSGSARDAPNRRVFFATDLTGAQVIAGPFDLTDALLTDPLVAQRLNEAVRAKAPKEGGVSVEGLAMHPKGGWLVGFRSPLSGPDGDAGLALVVRVQMKTELSVVVSAAELDLGDRGVRSVARDGEGFLIVAGQTGGGDDFALYRWDGDSDSAQPVSTQALDDLRVEGLVKTPTGWLALSDDGKVTRPDEQADDGDRGCDKIRKKNSLGSAHPSVYARVRDFTL